MHSYGEIIPPFGFLPVLEVRVGVKFSPLLAITKGRCLAFDQSTQAVNQSFQAESPIQLVQQNFDPKDQDIASLPKQALFETSISGCSSCLAAKIPDLKNPVGVEPAGSPAIVTKADAAIGDVPVVAFFSESMGKLSHW